MVRRNLCPRRRAWAYLYRAIDEHGQVVDVLLRSRRDLAGVKAFCAQAIARRRSAPHLVITDKHSAYPSAVREEVPHARRVQTGLHRMTGRTCLPIERSHVPVKDRIRPMRGLQAIRTGQCIAEGIELASAIRRGDVQIGSLQDLNRLGLSDL